MPLKKPDTGREEAESEADLAFTHRWVLQRPLVYSGPAHSGNTYLLLFIKPQSTIKKIEKPR